MRLVQAATIREYEDDVCEKFLSINLDTDIYVGDCEQWKDAASKCDTTRLKVRGKYDVGETVFIAFSNKVGRRAVYQNIEYDMGSITIKKLDNKGLYKSENGQLFLVPNCDKDEVMVTGLKWAFKNLKSHEIDYNTDISNWWIRDYRTQVVEDMAIVVDGKVVRLTDETIEPEKETHKKILQRIDRLLGIPTGDD